MENNNEQDLLNIPKIIKTIANLLSEIVKGNACKPLQENDPFASKKVSSVTLRYYLERIKKYSKLENSTLIITLMYIDRICSLNNFILSPYNIHRILFGCFLVAIKYNEDNIYDNQFYSEVGGVSLEETNYLEYSALKLLNFNLFISEDDFSKYLHYLKGD